VDLIVDDANDNTRGIVQLQGDTSGDNNTLVNYTDYDAYGNPVTESGGSTNPGGIAGTDGVTYQSLAFGFGSSYLDSTGLSYLVHRYYDPEGAQFVSVDPDVSPTLQPYTYALDDPIANSDALGTSSAPHSIHHDDTPEECGEATPDTYCVAATAEATDVHGQIKFTWGIYSGVSSYWLAGTIAGFAWKNPSGGGIHTAHYANVKPAASSSITWSHNIGPVGVENGALISIVEDSGAFDGETTECGGVKAVAQFFFKTVTIHKKKYYLHYIVAINGSTFSGCPNNTPD
jgi:RHS repeat-associated protein